MATALPDPHTLLAAARAGGLGLVGRRGSGKTTIVRMLADRLAPGDVALWRTHPRPRHLRPVLSAVAGGGISLLIFDEILRHSPGPWRELATAAAGAGTGLLWAVHDVQDAPAVLRDRAAMIVWLADNGFRTGADRQLRDGRARGLAWRQLPAATRILRR